MAIEDRELASLPAVEREAMAGGKAAAARLLGRSVPRRDGPDKVTGRTRFIDDLTFPGAWFGLTVRSSEPHARIVRIDRDPGFDWSRVVVLTAADIPGRNVVTLMVDDQPVLAADVVNHVSEPIALVAAPDAATARAARDALHVRLEPLPAVLDPFESEHAFAAFDIVKGDAEAGLDEADVVVVGRYRVGYQEQLYLEPQGVIALPHSDGTGLTIYGSLQCPYYVHTAVARALGLDGDSLSIVQAETGGGFGGKEEFPSGLAIHAGLLALRLERPVRMIYDRHEDLAATTKRHPAVVTHRTGVTRDGRLVAQDIEVVMDAGAYSTLSPVVLSRGALHAAGPYACPNVTIRARAMATHTPPNGAMRGFGAPQTEFAVEMQVNKIAEALGVSPAELRRRWAYRIGDVTPTGQVLRESVGAVQALEAAVACGEFEASRSASDGVADPGSRSKGAVLDAAGRPAGHIVSGAGLALGWHGAGFTGSGERHLASVASVELTREGAVRVLSDSTEIGQGSRTVLAQLVADALEIPMDAVEVAPTNTSIIPNSGPTVASRTTMIVGGLLVRAARQLRDEVEARTGRPFAGSYADDARDHGPSRCDVQFEGYPNIEWDEATHRGDAYPCFSYGAVTAKVDVDLDTGEVHVRSVVAADEIGRVVNPLLASGQVEGGTLQGVGYATIEEVKSERGRYLNDRLATYLIPTALDAPELTAVLLEEPFSAAPHGAKGLGELPLDMAAPAVVAAIHDATGVWIDELPATPERILAALEGAAVGDIAEAPTGPDAPPSVSSAGEAAAARDVPATAERVSEAASARAAQPPAAKVAPATIHFRVNGLPVEYAGPGGRRLIDVLRVDLGLTGTKEGCGEGECGTCSILLDGRLVTSCLLAVCQVEGHEVTTVEALRCGGALDPLQTAFLDAGAAQCGFCTPGMLMAGKAFLDGATAGDPGTGAAFDDQAIRRSIAGNLCRCTGYTKIVEAIRDVASCRPDANALAEASAAPADGRLPVQVVEGRGGPTAVSPSTLTEALELLDRGGLRPLAGGTDLLVELAPAGPDPLGRALRRPLLDLSRLAELRGIRMEGESLVVGAATTFAELCGSTLVAATLPVLAEAAASVGAVQIQNRGTIGGNAVNASPAGDLLPVLLATDAVLVTASVRGSRAVAAADFWPAYRRTALEPGELLVAIRFPIVPGRVTRFRKVGTRRAQAISKAVMAVSWLPDGDGTWHDVRVALGSVAPTPIRVAATEAVLEGAAPSAALASRAAATVAAEIRPIDDIRSTAAYRRSVSGRVLRRLILDAIG